MEVKVTLKMEMKKEVKMEVARGRWREEGGARKVARGRRRR